MKWHVFVLVFQEHFFMAYRKSSFASGNYHYLESCFHVLLPASAYTIIYYVALSRPIRGTLTSWLVCLSSNLAVLWSWERHLTLTVLLLTQVYKWVLANLMLGVTL